MIRRAIVLGALLLSAKAGADQDEHEHGEEPAGQTAQQVITCFDVLRENIRKECTPPTDEDLVGEDKDDQDYEASHPVRSYYGPDDCRNAQMDLFLSCVGGESIIFSVSEVPGDLCQTALENNLAICDQLFLPEAGEVSTDHMRFFHGVCVAEADDQDAFCTGKKKRTMDESGKGAASWSTEEGV